MDMVSVSSDNLSISTASRQSLPGSCVMRWIRSDPRRVVKDKNTATHFDLTGGMYCITEEEREVFYSMAARDVLNREFYFLVEKRMGDVSPFYVDLDYSALKALEETEVSVIASNIITAVRDFYSTVASAMWESLSLCAVSMANEPCFVKNSDGRDFLKSGVHLVFPNLFVSQKQAEDIANYIIQFMLRNFPNDLNTASWGSIIDLSVYSPGKSLRMIGSAKASRCPDCGGGRRGKGIPSNLCPVCCNSRTPGIRISGSSGRQYLPVLVLVDNGSMYSNFSRRFRDDLQFAMTFSSIYSARDHRPVSGFTLPLNYEPIVCKRDGFAIRLHCDEISLDDKRVKIMKDIIVKSRPSWRLLGISKVKERSKNNVGKHNYLINVFGAGSHFCANKNGNHSANTVYFIAKSTGIYQHCFSKKNPSNGSSVSCSKYQSEPIAFSSYAEVSTLFPEMNTGKSMSLDFAKWSFQLQDCRENVLRRTSANEWFTASVAICPSISWNDL